MENWEIYYIDEIKDKEPIEGAPSIQGWRLQMYPIEGEPMAPTIPTCGTDGAIEGAHRPNVQKRVCRLVSVSPIRDHHQTHETTTAKKTPTRNHQPDPSGQIHRFDCSPNMVFWMARP